MNTKEFQALIEAVREDSRQGELTPVAEEAFPEGEAEFIALGAEAGAADIISIRESGRWYLFSDRHMTRQYAEAAALGASGDSLRMIAATVRSESAIYPRPTPVETFFDRPYSLKPSDVKEAVAKMLADPGFADIKGARASNGAEFLFSSDHLDPDQAAAIAEWLAVGRFENP